MTFKDLNLIEPLLRAVTEKGYDVPTPIQQQAIPPALEGRDLMGCAQTGTGKTAAFILPILQQLLASAPHGKRPIRALVLTPTRELAIQIDDCCREYATHTSLRHMVIFGGVNQRPQVDELKRGVDLLIATPGRLIDLMGQGHISLSEVRFFVLDEADRMLDMGFIHDIRRIIPQLPKERQTLFFSATMPSDIVALASSMLRDPIQITVTPQATVVETISQSICYVEKSDKKDRLIEILQERSEGSVLVFSRTKHGADRIARILSKAGIEARAIHGDKSQGARERAMTDFRSGDCRVLIATDIAARGIDISELPLVINYDLPEVAETYVHRIGRTGRAGCEGTAISFCSEDERPLLKDIQKLTGLLYTAKGNSAWGELTPGGTQEEINQRSAPQKQGRGQNSRPQRPSSKERKQVIGRKPQASREERTTSEERSERTPRAQAAPKQERTPRTQAAPKQEGSRRGEQKQTNEGRNGEQRRGEQPQTGRKPQAARREGGRGEGRTDAQDRNSRTGTSEGRSTTPRTDEDRPRRSRSRNRGAGTSGGRGESTTSQQSSTRKVESVEPKKKSRWWPF